MRTLKTYKVVVSANVEPIPFWKYETFDAASLPTEARSLQNIQGYIRYRSLQLALSKYNSVSAHEVVTKPTVVNTPVVNFEFTVGYYDVDAIVAASELVSGTEDEHVISVLETIILDSIKEDIVENQQVVGTVGKLTYPMASANNRNVDNAYLVIQTKEVTAAGVTPTVTVTKV